MILTSSRDSEKESSSERKLSILGSSCIRLADCRKIIKMCQQIIN